MSDDLLKQHRDAIDSIDAHILELINERARHAQKMEGDYFNSVGIGLTIEAQEIYHS